MRFTLYRMDDCSNIFLVIEDKDELPLVVHGLLKVEGKNYKTASCSLNSISDKLFESEQFEELQDTAMIRYFNVD